VRAEGESEATKLICNATLFAGTGLIELRRIKLEISATLSKSCNVVYLPPGNNMLLGVNPSFTAAL
jgi:prohibitin 1